MTTVAVPAPHSGPPITREQLTATEPLDVRRSTPARMRLTSLLLVIIGVLVGAAGGWSYLSADGAVGRAQANAAQLVRLQDLQTNLVSADANATNAFLVGGLEPADKRSQYDQAMAAVTALVAQAAKAQPADGQVLADLNTDIARYATTIEQARAANRQALPVGSQYLRNASADLRADALPALAALIDANSQRARREMDAAQSAWVLAVLAGAGGVIAVGFTSVWLSRRTHRLVNVPLTAAAGVLVTFTIGSAIWLGSIGSHVAGEANDAYQAASALSDARLAAYDAKANESLTLIARGTGGAFQEAWVTSAARTTDALMQAGQVPALDDGVHAAHLATLWSAYESAHESVRALDDSGDWDQAVAAATDDTSGSVNDQFAAYDKAATAALTYTAQATSNSLSSAGHGLAVGLWLAVTAGLAVSLLSYSGIARRIEEYR